MLLPSRERELKYTYSLTGHTNVFYNKCCKIYCCQNVRKYKMKSDEIKELFTKFESVATEVGGVECWSARELQELLGYSKWENFASVCPTAGLLRIFYPL